MRTRRSIAALEAAHRAYAADRADRPRGGARLGWRGRHAHGREVPARALRLPPRGWRRIRSAHGPPHVEPVHAEQRPGRVAAIDQGTNSIRLLVAEPPATPASTELARDMVITRLGKGVDRTGRLDPERWPAPSRCSPRYCRRARALGAERIRVGATSAVRDAENREALRRRRARARRRRPRGPHRRAGGRAVVPRCDARARSRRGPVPGARHRRRFDRVRDRGPNRAAPSAPSRRRWGACGSPSATSVTTRPRPRSSRRWRPRRRTP